MTTITQPSIVDTVLTLFNQSLHFRVEVPLDDARVILQKMGKYNDIPENLASLVDDLKQKLGPIEFGNNNPNDGKFHNITFMIGQESSLVIYVTSHLFYRKHDSIGQHEAMLEVLGARYHADEVDVTREDDTVSARFWWD